MANFKMNKNGMKKLADDLSGTVPKGKTQAETEANIRAHIKSIGATPNQSDIRRAARDAHKKK